MELFRSLLLFCTVQHLIQFMEKLPDGRCCFRNARCEERIAKKFEDEIQRKRENLVMKVQREISCEETDLIKSNY